MSCWVIMRGKWEGQREQGWKDSAKTGMTQWNGCFWKAVPREAWNSGCVGHSSIGETYIWRFQAVILQEGRVVAMIQEATGSVYYEWDTTEAPGIGKSTRSDPEGWGGGNKAGHLGSISSGRLAGQSQGLESKQKAEAKTWYLGLSHVVVTRD